jgi:hypothetical protein
MVETPNDQPPGEAVNATCVDLAAYVVMIPAMIVGALPVFAKMFGYEFLPSQSWVGEARIAGYCFALVSAWSMAHILFWSPFATARARHLGRTMPATWIKVGGVLIFAGVANWAVVVGVPLLQAIIVGKQISLPYVVESASGFSDSKCPAKITLTSMPIGFDGACGFPVEFREQLEPGTMINLHGRGTANGLFYDRVELAKPG